MNLTSVSIAWNREQILRLDRFQLPLLGRLLLLRKYPEIHGLAFMVIDVSAAEHEVALPMPLHP